MQDSVQGNEQQFQAKLVRWREIVRQARWLPAQLPNLDYWGSRFHLSNHSLICTPGLSDNFGPRARRRHCIPRLRHNFRRIRNCRLHHSYRHLHHNCRHIRNRYHSSRQESDMADTSNASGC